MDEHALLTAVDAAFAVTGRGLEPWADPHPDRSPPDEAYSRLTDAARWRIVGARADAWLVALAEAGLARVEREAAVAWAAAPGTVLTRTDRAVPLVPGALPLILARSRLGDVDDAGVTLGVGDPAVCVTWFPDCGCDACDSGSEAELDHLDTWIADIVSGRYRRLSSGDRVITVTGDGIRSASGVRGRDIDAILARPTGWAETTGGSWSRLAPR